MSSKSRKRKPTRQEYSIARALKSFGGTDEAQLCAFLEEMEQARLGGIVLGWRITRDYGGCQFEVMFPDGSQAKARGATFREAGKDISAQLIHNAMQGAPEA